MAFTAIPIQAATTRTFSNLVASYPLDYSFLFNAGVPYLRNGQETITIQDGAAIAMDGNIKKVTVTITWDYRQRTIASGSPMRKDVVTYFSSSGINRR